MATDLILICTEDNPSRVYARLTKDPLVIKQTPVEYNRIVSSEQLLEMTVERAFREGFLNLDDPAASHLNPEAKIMVKGRVEKQVMEVQIENWLIQRSRRTDVRPLAVSEEVPFACSHPRHFLSKSSVEELDAYIETFKNTPLSVDYVPPKYMVFLDRRKGNARSVFKIIEWSTLDLTLIDVEGREYHLDIRPKQRKWGFRRYGILFYPHNIGVIDCSTGDLVI